MTELILVNSLPGLCISCSQVLYCTDQCLMRNKNCHGLDQMSCFRFYKILNSRIHDFTKFCVYNLDAMLRGIRKIAELQESGQKLTKPQIGRAIIILLEAPLNIGSKS